MKIVVALTAAAIIAATSAALAKVAPCDSAGHYEEKTTNIYGKPITITRGTAFDWAVRQQRSFVDDAGDPIGNTRVRYAAPYRNLVLPWWRRRKARMSTGGFLLWSWHHALHRSQSAA
jgi:hypothetical protein